MDAVQLVGPPPFLFDHETLPTAGSCWSLWVLDFDFNFPAQRNLIFCMSFEHR